MRHGGDRRGNSRTRRARKLWLLKTHDTDLGPNEARCHLMLSPRCLGILDYATVTADRINSAGPYRRENLAGPACAPCQSLQGAQHSALVRRVAS
jgi:hypothetical protein